MLDVMTDRWWSYEIDPMEIYFAADGDAGAATSRTITRGCQSARERERVERTWRYEYKLGTVTVRGIASIAASAGLARARIIRHLRNEAQREAA